MSAPRAKRPFAGAAADPSQRQITAFFSSTRPGSTTAPSQKHSQRPVLPDDVESDLLSVGMRTRKAVQDGHKTGSYNAFSLFNIHTPIRTRRGAAGAGELVPFCGMHKVGGHAVQPALPADDDDEDVPGLTSSQETVGSIEFENSRKRGFEEEDEELAGDMVGSEGNRVIAVPRRRRKGAKDQENMGISVDDFEEADFLAEREIAMSDV